MDTNGHESKDNLLHGEWVFRVVGCAFGAIKITGHRVGLIINFKRAKIEWERAVL